jgi:hypothetical protein
MEVMLPGRVCSSTRASRGQAVYIALVRQPIATLDAGERASYTSH